MLSGRKCHCTLSVGGSCLVLAMRPRPLPRISCSKGQAASSSMPMLRVAM
ncbi:Uncharacterised protein [Bordetella pertussis]|nr:Uncharacterised protein [Bordetella pertussis]